MTKTILNTKMKSHKDVIACVIDFGMIGVPMAERLSREFKHVYLFQEWEDAYSTLNKAISGDGFDNVERVPDIWSVKNEVDLFVFPDVQRSGLQLELESQGKAVWGARTGDAYELNREMFLKTLSEVGMDVPEYKVVVGLTALRDYLKDKVDYYIKVSLFRGSCETFQFRSMEEDQWRLDSLGVTLGPAGELLRFLCFPNIDTPLEIGADTYCIDGNWPKEMLHGVEWKDRSYLGVVTPRDEMPKQIRQVLSNFGPKLGKRRYRNQFSMEVRVKGPKSYFIDATCRMGLPSTASQLELYKNFGEIVWHGANGELVEPKLNARYSAEGIVTMSGSCEEWRVADVPNELRQWLKLADCCEIKGKVCFPAGESGGGDEVGWLVAIGDSIEDVVKKICKQADMLPDGMDCNVECLAYVIKEIHTMSKAGIRFGNQPIPKAGIVMGV